MFNLECKELLCGFQVHRLTIFPTLFKAVFPTLSQAIFSADCVVWQLHRWLIVVQCPSFRTSEAFTWNENAKSTQHARTWCSILTLCLAKILNLPNPALMQIWVQFEILFKSIHITFLDPILLAVMIPLITWIVIPTRLRRRLPRCSESSTHLTSGRFNCSSTKYEHCLSHVSDDESIQPTQSQFRCPLTYT